MQLLIALTPLVLTVASILWLKRGPLMGCFIGIVALFLLINTNEKFFLSISRLSQAFQSAFYLGLSVAFVMLPGLYLTEILKEKGIIAGIAEKFKILELDPAVKLLVMVLGIAPAVESLTGFGVSLFLTIPILSGMFTNEKTQRLALLGMNIMPWGTMGLATTLGASLIGLKPNILGMASAIASSFVFPVVGLIALYVMGGFGTLKKWSVIAIIQGLLLALFLYLNARYFSVELAGVVSGLLMSLIMLLFFWSRKNSAINENTPSVIQESSLQASYTSSNTTLCYLMGPYVAVFLILVVTHVVPFSWRFMSSHFILSNARVSFAPLTSPGFSLLIVAIFLKIKNGGSVELRDITKRAQKPILATFCFLLFAQLMREAGIIDVIAQNVAQFQIQILWLLSPLTGMLSGFTTASNVGGNVLMMQVQYQVGALNHSGIVFAAMQNSAAGHTVFASLPIILLVQTLCNDTKAKTTQTLLSFTFGSLGFVLLALMLGFMLVYWLS